MVAKQLEPRACLSIAPMTAARHLLDTPDALLTRSHLQELGLERRAIDAVFRALPTVVLPGYRRALIRAEDYRRLLGECTHRGDRVRHV